MKVWTRLNNWRNRLWLEEQLTLLLLILSVALNLYFGVSFFSGGEKFLSFYFGVLIPVFIGLALLGGVVLKQATDRLNDPQTNPFNRESLLHITRIAFLLVVGFYAYFHLKVLIPLINPANYDPLFFRLDELLFLGNSPTHALLEIENGWFIIFMKFSYASYMAAFPFTIALTFLFRDLMGLRRIVLGIVIIYLFGIALYYLLPAWGPLFTNPDRFAHIPNVWGERLWEGHLAIQRDPATFQATPFLGIAAFPSLHAAHFLFLLILGVRYIRPLIWLYIPWTILMYISTIFLGWHYVVDLIVGSAIALIVLRLTRHLRAQGRALPPSDNRATP